MARSGGSLVRTDKQGAVFKKSENGRVGRFLLLHVRKMARLSGLEGVRKRGTVLDLSHVVLWVLVLCKGHLNVGNAACLCVKERGRGTNVNSQASAKVRVPYIHPHFDLGSPVRRPPATCDYGTL